MEQRNRLLPLGRLNLNVIEWGPIEAPPIVMLHGIRGYAETFSELARALQPDWRVIALDQRGRGASDWDSKNNYYTDAYVADLERLVEALELTAFDLLGHSMGGINAIVYAARHPQRVRRLVIEDAGPGAFESSNGARRIRQELQAAPLRFASWTEAVHYLQMLRPGISEAARQQRLHHMLRGQPDGTFTWRHDHQGITSTRLNPDPARVVDLAPLVAALTCPTLVLRGARSDYLQPALLAAMHALNPQLTSATVPDAGHSIHDDQPERVARLVRDFLRTA